MSDDQHRKYMLTIQDPINKGYSHDIIRDILHSLKVDYFCMADEVATTGMPHTHVFCYRHTAIRAKTIRTKFADVHYDYCYGSCADTRAYIAKTGKWAETDKAKTSVDGSFEEFGELPDEKCENHPDNFELIKQIEAGATTAEIVKENPKYIFRSNDINILRETLLADKFSREERDIEVTYIYGPTGTGKTRYIFDSHDPVDICRITNYGNNLSSVKFDSYHGQDVLVFEEFHSQIDIAQLLCIIDRYPVNLPARYSDRVATFTKVYFTSNISLENQYPDIKYNKPEVWRAFRRRITRVVEFNEFGQVEIISHDNLTPAVYPKVNK